MFGLLFLAFEILRVIEENAYFKKELIRLGFSDNSMLVCILYNVMKIKNHHNKNLDIFALYIFGLNCCLHP